jgi:hypothetical protein
MASSLFCLGTAYRWAVEACDEGGSLARLVFKPRYHRHRAGWGAVAVSCPCHVQAPAVACEVPMTTPWHRPQSTSGRVRTSVAVVYCHLPRVIRLRIDRPRRTAACPPSSLLGRWNDRGRPRRSRQFLLPAALGIFADLLSGCRVATATDVEPSTLSIARSSGSARSQRRCHLVVKHGSAGQAGQALRARRWPVFAAQTFPRAAIIALDRPAWLAEAAT